MVAFEPRHEKANNVVSKQVRHNPSCTSTEDGLRLEILGLESREIILSVQQKTEVQQKTKALISLKLICAFVLPYADCWVSHGVAHF